MPGYPSGTVTFLFTDVERSTSLWERDAALARLVVDRQLAIIRGAVQSSGGVHFKTIGDGTQSAFHTAPQGVTAALAAQHGLIVEPWTNPEARPRVRMALHAGVAEPQDGDYLAGCLNRLARLLEAAHGEQILLSETVTRLVGDALPADARVKALGEYRLRDILQPEEVFQLQHPALPNAFPPLNTPGVRPHNLPNHPTPFLGRERELEEIEALLMQPDVRLVTLTGPGGVGKTRLALRVAGESLEAFSDGVFLVDLARQTDPLLAPSATATALGLREQPGQTLTETLAAYLRDKRMLLLFDNFEHLLPAATVVADLLAAAPGLTVLATSRARLGLQAEHEYRVETLPVPDLEALPPLDELARYDAVTLFVSRARALRPSFALTAQNAAAIGEIVCRLDGLPLAIELAAARMKLLSPEGLRDRLGRRLTTLTGGARDLPARQRTLRDTIVWSHDLLAPAEQVLFRRLSVFVGGWTLAGAEAVAAVPADVPVDALRDLSGLVDQSLVDERPQSGVAPDEPRFTMLETIREFAVEQLAASDEMVAVEHAFEEFFIARAEQAEEGLKGPDQPLWLGRLEDEHDNLRAGLGRILERGDGVAALNLAPRLWRFWRYAGHPGEGRSWLERSLAAATDAEVAARSDAEFGLGKLSIDLGDFAGADAHFRTCISLRRELENPLAVAEALSSLAVVAVNRRTYDEARTLGEEALRISRKHGDRRSEATSLHDLGLVAREEGDHARALELFESSLTIWRTLADLSWIAAVTLGLGVTYPESGNLHAAEEQLNEAQDHYRKLGDRYGLAVATVHRGHIARESGDVERAIAFYAEALRAFDSVGASEAVVECVEWLAVSAADVGNPTLAFRLFGATAAARDALRLPPPGESGARLVAQGLDLASKLAVNAKDVALAAGRALTIEQARDEALGLSDVSQRHASVAAEVILGQG